MSENKLKEKLNALNRATESFRKTKKRIIKQICSVGVKWKILKYPALVAAFVFIFFVNVAFYICLFIMVDKRKAIGAGIVTVALIGLIVVFSDYNNAGKLYAKTQDEYTVLTQKEDASRRLRDGNSEKETKKTEEPEEETDFLSSSEWYERIDVDFDGLKEKNADIIGWLYFENLDISYPILQGDTNDEYLRTSYVGKLSRSGSIFLDTGNNNDFEDFHSIIYGHNMRDGSMFGKLANYRMDAGFYKGHETFQIITPLRKYRYTILSCKQVKEDDLLYDLSITEEYAADEFVDNFILNDSMLGIGLRAADRDKIVTLSTCSSGENRFVVSAYRIAERDND